MKLKSKPVKIQQGSGNGSGLLLQDGNDNALKPVLSGQSNASLHNRETQGKRRDGSWDWDMQLF